jgi:hypothetical protein
VIGECDSDAGLGHAAGIRYGREHRLLRGRRAVPEFHTGVNPNLGSAQTLNQWFNTAAFVQAANSTFGNLSRTFTAVRQDWTRYIDLSFFKNFKIKEKVQLQFRAGAFNFTNTPIMSAPNTTVGSTAFGIVSGQSNSPRTVQLALKVIF